MAGAGTLVLAASNTYTGSTTINAGTLQLGDGVSHNGSVARQWRERQRQPDLCQPQRPDLRRRDQRQRQPDEDGRGRADPHRQRTYTGGTAVSGGTLDFASPAALPTTGILNVGRSGSIDLSTLLMACVPSTVDTSPDQTSLADSPSDSSIGQWTTGDAAAGSNNEVSLPRTVHWTGAWQWRACPSPRLWSCSASPPSGRWPGAGESGTLQPRPAPPRSVYKRVVHLRRLAPRRARRHDRGHFLGLVAAVEFAGPAVPRRPDAFLGRNGSKMEFRATALDAIRQQS